MPRASWPYTAALPARSSTTVPECGARSDNLICNPDFADTAVYGGPRGHWVTNYTQACQGTAFGRVGGYGILWYQGGTTRRPATTSARPRPSATG